MLPEPVMLYDTPRAPNPRRVRIFLAEKGIELPTTPVDIMAGEQFRDYRERVGSHNVPALELSDGTVLTETVTICRYLESIHPTPNLLGEDALEAARIEMWSRRMEFQLMMPVAFVARHGIPAMGVLEHGEQCPEWAAANGPRVDAALVWLEEALSGRDWLASDRFTLADITAFATLGFMRLIKKRVPEDHAATQAWLSRCADRGTMVD
ncbi:glutathione S-transferase family protein [Roseobacter sp. HKCCA0434]|uniref:glutathione S-transferase family protein n=1 Tax=Roseobacter sp. HKCCA0434 TaxID=3079297 RepID=UPI002905E7DF|nr:glutathione S-transferase family protein [Roseobacter sp. HKCCA0434]